MPGSPNPRVLDRFFRSAACALLLALLPLVPAAPVAAQEPNLLQNPGFEEPYTAPIPGKENCFIASPWVAWYVEGSPQELKQGYLLAPEYKPAIRADYPGNRVRNGERSQQWFHSFGNFEAGVYQVVPNVQVGTTYRFDLWVLTWSCDDESKGNCAGATSGNPSPMHVRIGIDPQGGTDVHSPSIVWSAEQNAYDAWHPFMVEAVAENTTITVFVYSYPDYRSQDNNVYIDDASLKAVAPPPTATPLPTNTPAETDTPAATPTPLPTNTPPPTPLPTSTTPATATVAPTDTLPPTLAPTVAETSAPAATATEPIAAATSTPAPSSTSRKPSGMGLAAMFGGGVLLIGVSLGIILKRRR